MILKKTAPSRPLSCSSGHVENLSQKVPDEPEEVDVMTLGLDMTKLPTGLDEMETDELGFISSPAVPPVNAAIDTENETNSYEQSQKFVSQIEI